MKTEKFGVMGSQAQECLDPPGAGRGRKEPSGGLGRKHSPAHTLTSDSGPQT